VQIGNYTDRTGPWSHIDGGCRPN